MVSPLAAEFCGVLRDCGGSGSAPTGADHRLPPPPTGPGKPAWQRLQVVKALKFYQQKVLAQAEPDLGDLHDTLAKLAEQEYVAKRSPPQHHDRLSNEIVGRIDPSEPEIIQKLRRELRRRHYADFVAAANRFQRAGGKALAANPQLEQPLNDVAIAMTKVMPAMNSVR